jgi:cation diffusion facilitator CzcD-associated flavoprotein CzcO
MSRSVDVVVIGAGKQASVSGAGPSGIQLIPPIAEQAAHLRVFRRPSNYVVLPDNFALYDATRAAQKDDYAEPEQLGADAASPCKSGLQTRLTDRRPLGGTA